jgi:hypothetical protein
MNYNPDADMVNNPPHYQTDSGLQPIDVIEKFDLNFNLGNAIKYILRSGKKGNKRQDLEKAIYYLRREINNLS